MGADAVDLVLGILTLAAVILALQLGWTRRRLRVLRAAREARELEGATRDVAASLAGRSERQTPADHPAAGD